MLNESLPETREKIKKLQGLPGSTAKLPQDSSSLHQKMKEGNDYKKGLWTQEEDLILLEYIKGHGRGQWNRIPKVTGLKRCGKSCRLRWLNYLSPNVKHGDFSEEEDDLIIRLHNLLGNRWSLIAGRVPGRTDNQVKNHWNTHLRKKLGIKKTKKEVGSSSTSHSYHTEDSNRLPDSMNSEHPESTEKVVDHGSGGTSNQEAEMINQQYYNESLFFPNDYNLNLYSPGLMEFLDGYPLDQIWQNN